MIKQSLAESAPRRNRSWHKRAGTRKRQPPETDPERDNDWLALRWLVAQRAGFSMNIDPETIRWSAVTPGIVRLAIFHRVLTPALQAPDSDRLPKATHAEMTEIADNVKLQGVRRLGVQARILQAFGDADIEVLLLKGQAFSALAYGDWSTRGYADDLDLLIAPEDVARAEATLQQMGFSPKGGYPYPTPGSRLARYALWLHYERGWRSPDMGSVDLHWRPLPGGAEWNSAAHCRGHSVEVELPIGRFRTLGPVESLIVACSQGESENWSRLKRLADLTAIERLCSPQELTKAAEWSSLVVPSLANQEARWHQLPLQPMADRSATRKISNLWNMRAGSGSRWDAAVRSTLGAVAPARKIPRSPESDQRPI